MREDILKFIAEVEAAQDCRVLFACESGSRAWGFPSPDSDFDVRFVYAHPVEWYLRIDPRPDTIEKMLPGDLDFGGWEVAKALGLFHGCNLAFNEWLNSPIVYLERGTLRRELAAETPAFFNARKAFHHYRSLAMKVVEAHLRDDAIGIKKLFYVLRPLYACLWIARETTMPPTVFQEMMGRDLVPDAIESWVGEILLKKETAPEGERLSLQREPASWLRQALENLEHNGAHLPVASEGKSYQRLNELLQKIVRAY